MSADDDLRDMLEALKRDYRRSLPATLVQIETAWKSIAEGSADAACVKALERALHSIAGAAGTFGMPALGSAAAEAETFMEPFVAGGDVPEGERARLRRLLDAVASETAK